MPNYNNALIQAVKEVTGVKTYDDAADVLDMLLTAPTDQLASAIAAEIMMTWRRRIVAKETASPLFHRFRLMLADTRPLTFAYMAQEQRFAIGERLYAHRNPRVRTYGSRLMYLHAPGTPTNPLAITAGDHVFKIEAHELTDDDWAGLTLSEAFLRKYRAPYPAGVASPTEVHIHLRIMARLEREITIDADLAAQTGEGRIVRTWWGKR